MDEEHNRKNLPSMLIDLSKQWEIASWFSVSEVPQFLVCIIKFMYQKVISVYRANFPRRTSLKSKMAVYEIASISAGGGHCSHCK